MVTSARADRFVEALRAGEPRAAQAADRLLRKMSRTDEPTHLTPRQAEVIELMARGLSDGEIALRLEVSAESVKKYVQAARDRLGARTRPHAVVLWLAKEAA